MGLLGKLFGKKQGEEGIHDPASLNEGKDVDKLLNRYHEEPEARSDIVKKLQALLEEGGNFMFRGSKEHAAHALFDLGHEEIVMNFLSKYADDKDERSGLGYLHIFNVACREAYQRKKIPLIRDLLTFGPFEYREVDSPHNLLECFEKEDNLLNLYLITRSRIARHYLCRQLGKIGGPKSLKVLKAVSEKGLKRVLDALKINAPCEIDVFEEEFMKDAQTAIADFIPRLSVDELQTLAGNKETVIKEMAILELCKRTDDSAFDTILTAASSKNEEICLEAVKALGRMRRRETVDTLGTLLQHPSDPVWHAAAEALGAIGDKSALEYLLGLNQEKLIDNVVLNAIAEGGAAPKLLEILKLQLDQFSTEGKLKLIVALRKVLAVSDLAELQDTLARPYAETLGDPAWAKRRTAIIALGQIGGNLATQILKERQEHEQDYELIKEIQKALIEAPQHAA